MRRLFILAGLAVLILASCERPARDVEEQIQTPSQSAVSGSDATLVGFRHEQTIDLSGYYLPGAAILVGDWRLHHIAMSDGRGFSAWEGGERPRTHGPIMMQFDDVSSPMASNELGGEHHTISARVLPEAYEVSDERVRFRGRAPGVGPVMFEGRLDTDALQISQRRLGGSESSVLVGTLTVGDRVFEGQRFRWWMGD